jgi:hypothetical protein
MDFVPTQNARTWVGTFCFKKCKKKSKYNKKFLLLFPVGPHIIKIEVDESGAKWVADPRLGGEWR